MDIAIYEDQTGLMQFPEKGSEKNSKIVTFFNNNIDLYIDKVGTNLSLCCHLIAHKASSRPTGYYIIYRDIHSDNIFVNFKKESDKILKNLELQIQTGHSDNMVFESIEGFDDNRRQHYKEDINIIREAINNRKNLDYSAGDIRDISVFCKYILRNTNNIKISISSTKNELGNINILLNKKSTSPLKRTEITESTIIQYGERLRERDKRERGTPGMGKIDEGFDSIKKGIDILKGVGYNNLEIRNEIERRKENIFISLPYRSELEKLEKERIEREKTKIEEEEKEEKEGHEQHTAAKILAVLLVIITIASGIILFKSGTLPPEILPQPIADILKITPTPTESPISIPIPPTILRHLPLSEIVNETEDNLSKFSIIMDQYANVTWYIKVDDNYSILIPTDNDKIESSYYNDSMTQGKRIINATATNANGTTSYEWTWIVTNTTNKLNTTMNTTTNKS